MSRLLLFFIFAFAISILGVALIAGVVVALAEIYYHGTYRWGYEDMRFILIKGSAMGLTFCVVGLLQYFQMGDRS